MAKRRHRHDWHHIYMSTLAWVCGITVAVAWLVSFLDTTKALYKF